LVYKAISKYRGFSKSSIEFEVTDDIEDEMDVDGKIIIVEPVWKWLLI